MFIKYEAEVSSRVGGSERGVVDFGKLFAETNEQKFLITVNSMTIKNRIKQHTVNSIFASEALQYKIMPHLFKQIHARISILLSSQIIHYPQSHTQKLRQERK